MRLSTTPTGLPPAVVESAPLSRRAERRQATIAEIKALARQQLAAEGPGELSLRAIARQMRVASSALYRYYPSVDELVTALCVDAYDSLAAALSAARDTIALDDPTGQLWAIYHAYRRWALAHPSDFALIFGTPIPGYQAPDGLTAAAAGRSFTLILSAYAAAVQSGAADPERSQVPATTKAGELLPALLTDAASDYAPRWAAIVLNAYASLLGYLTAETFGSLTRLVDDTDQLFDAHVRSIMLGMGFDPW